MNRGRNWHVWMAILLALAVTLAGCGQTKPPPQGSDSVWGRSHFDQANWQYGRNPMIRGRDLKYFPLGAIIVTSSLAVAWIAAMRLVFVRQESIVGTGALGAALPRP